MKLGREVVSGQQVDTLQAVGRHVPRGSGVRAQQAADTRARVFAAALAALSDPTPQLWSMDAIAAAAGVTRMTVHNHFGSRTTLIEAVLDHVVTRDRIDHLFDGTEQLDPADALRSVIAGTCSLWHAERPLLQRLFAAAYTEPAVAVLLARRESWRRDQLTALLRRTTPALHRDAAMLDLLVAVTSFPTYHQLRPGEQKPKAAARLLDRLAQTLLNGAAGNSSPPAGS